MWVLHSYIFVAISLISISHLFTIKWKCQVDKNIVRFCFFYQFLSSEQMYRDELRKGCTPNFSQGETQFPAVAERLRQLETVACAYAHAHNPGVP